MKSNLEDFKTGWYGLTLGIDLVEIDKLIAALNNLKDKKDHFHFRSEFKGDGGIGDIEFYFNPEENNSDLEIESDFRTTEN